MDRPVIAVDDPRRRRGVRRARRQTTTPRSGRWTSRSKTNHACGLRGFTGTLFARLGWALLHEGEWARAEVNYDRALEAARRVRNEPVLLLALTGIAVVHRSHGRNQAAADAALEALELYRIGHSRRFRNRVDPKRDLPVAVAACQVVLAAIAAERDDPESAATRLGQAARLRSDAGAELPAFPAGRGTAGPRPGNCRPRARPPSRPRTSGRASASRRFRTPDRQVQRERGGCSACSWRVAVVPQTLRANLQEDPLSAFLFRLGRSSARHPFRVLGLWIVAAIAIVALQGASGGQFVNRFRVPGAESQHAADVLNDRVPEPRRPVVAHRAPHGPRPSRRHRPRGKPSARSATNSPTGHDVAGVAPGAISPNGKTSYLDVAYSVDKLTETQFGDATKVTTEARRGGVSVELTGEMAQLAQQDPSSELIGIGVAIIVLLMAFGSVVAMGLPIVTALVGIFVGASAVGVLSAVMDVPEFFADPLHDDRPRCRHRLRAVHRHPRHRQHLHDGMSVEDAAGTANATAGQAVLFAGCTVVIAILGLFLAGLPTISAMGVSVALVVTVAMAAAITLLPGLLGLAGTKIDKLSIHRKGHVTKPATETFSGRWAHHVGTHPVRYAVVGLGILCAIAVPSLSMRIGTPDDGNAATHTTQRIAYDHLAAGFGRGFNGPIQVVVEVPAGPSTGARSTACTRHCGPTPASRTSPRPRSTPPATRHSSPPIPPPRRRTHAPTDSSATSGPTCCPARCRAQTPGYR